MRLSNLKNLAVDSFIYGISGMVLKLISFVLFPIFAHHFTPSSYGTIGILISMNLVLVTISGLGLEAAATRWFYDKDDPIYKNKIFYKLVCRKIRCVNNFISAGFFCIQKLAYKQPS